MGSFALNPGALMASSNTFRIVLHGQGTHASLPHTGTDPVAATIDLAQQLQTLVARFFETGSVTARFRPHHFPFTEPSAEMDIQCDRSGGELKIGQGSDWLEILGCGMVHPNVLRHCGIDPDEYQGFAFGLGVDRLAMLKYGVPDLRDMFAGDVRWLAHYGFSAFAAPNPASGLS